VVETAETLPNGQKVKLPRVQALRKMLLKWTGTVRLSIFKKYGELLERVERQAEKAIQFEPADLAAEIERVEKRLAALKEEKGKQDKDDKEITTPVSRMAKSLARQGLQEQTEFRDHVDQAAAARAGVAMERLEETPEATPPVPSPGRQPILPQSAPPPGAAKPNVAPQPPPAAPVVATPPAQPPAAPEKPPVPPSDDSFVDPGDTDAMNAAVLAENQRLIALRRAAIAQQQAGAMPPLPPGARRPPHLDARDAAMSDYRPEDFDESQLTSHLVRKAPDGVNAVQLQPPEELSQPRPNAQRERVPLNQADPKRGAGNPRFRPPPK